MKYFALAAILLLAAPAPAGAQWSWVYPKPQGQTLYDVAFLDNSTAIAVGEYGTIMVTHNTGASWTVQTRVQSITTDLSRIEKVDANTAVVVGRNGIILRTSNQGATWVLAPASSSNDLLDLSFGDATHGIIAAGNAVLRSSDGGLTWIPVPSPSGNMVSVDMLSATEAISLTPLYRSNDGGATWSPMTMPVGVTSGDALDFLDPLRGAFAVASVAGTPYVPERCCSTTDGGNTWTISAVFNSSTNACTPTELIYPASNWIEIMSTIRVSPTEPLVGHVASSTDGGLNWYQTGPVWPMNGIGENGSGTALSVGKDGKILRPTTAGGYFIVGGPNQDPEKYPVGGVSFANAQSGIVFCSAGETVANGISDTYFTYTSNGGNTWGYTWVGGTQCVDIVCLSPTEAIAVGMDATGTKGNILRSTNGGATWSLIWSQANPSRLRSVCAYSSTGAFAVGNSGKLIGINHGSIFTTETGGSGFVDIAYDGGATAFAAGATDMRSFDEGKTWTPAGDQSTDVFAIAFASPAFAPHPSILGITTTGVYNTFDAGPGITIGDLWIRQLSATGLTDVSLSFDPSYGVYGMAVGSKNFVIDRYQFFEAPTDLPLNRVSVVSRSASFASGPQANTFRYQYQQPVPTLIRSLDVTARDFGADLRWDVLPDNHLASFAITRSDGTLRETIASELAVTSRSFRDAGLLPGTTYEYQLVATDQDGSFTQSMPVRVTIPKASVELLPNQPNPFNPETTIRFVVPAKMRVTLTVHDVSGRLVAILMDGVRDAGAQSVTWNAHGIASGVYFVKLRAEKTEVSRKMVLLK